MVKVKQANRVYTINESELASYAAQGFYPVDEKTGKVIKPKDKKDLEIEELTKSNTALTAKNAELEKQLKAANKKLAAAAKV